MVIERSGVARAEFDRHFAGKEDCYMQLFWEYTGAFDREVFGAYRAEAQWRDAVRACAYAAARYIRDHPREVACGVTLMFTAGDLAQAYRENHLQRIVDLIDAGRQELDDPDSMTRGVAEGVIGSIYQLLVRELQSGNGTGSAEDFVPDLMYLAVRPYLGNQAALEELSIPPPPEPGEEGG